MSGQDRSCDVLVVGRGAAGCVASLRLAEAGAEVILIGRETSATALSTGRIDLQGIENAEVISSTLRKLGAEYGLYQEPVQVRDVISNCGTVAHQSLTSTHDWLAEPTGEGTAVMGLKGNADLDPITLCSALGKARPDLMSRPFRAELDLPSTISSGSAPLLTEEARGAVDRIAGALEDLNEHEVVLPPLFVGPHYHWAWSALEKACGRRVREPMTPLSNPGRRLQVCLEESAVKAGCLLMKERELCGLVLRRGRVMKATLRSGIRELSIRPKAVILATGNLVGGGLAVTGEEVVDPLGLFAVASVPGRELSSLPMTRYLSIGLRNEGGRAVLIDGTVAEDVFVVGSAVPGCSYPLGRGVGQAMADAWAKVDLVKEAL